MSDQYDIVAVKNAFTANPELFINEYYPNAKKKGNNYLIGDVYGADGDSTLICVAGKHAGKYKDFADGNPMGDFIDMLSLKSGKGTIDATREIAELYNIKPSISFDRKPIEIKKVDPIKPVVACEDRIRKYLTEERGISERVIDLYKIESVGNSEIAFPYLDLNGEIIQRSYVSLKRGEDGKKISMQDKNANKMFFGLHLMDKNARQIIITEGQIDCMTLTEVGIPNAVSMPAGVNNLDWIDTHWDYLMSFDTIVLAFDQDKAGDTCVAQVSKRLGIERCKIVKFDENDINDLWNNGYDEDDIKKIFAGAEYIPNDSVSALGSSREATKKYFKEKEENQGIKFFLNGVDLPQRLGDLTIWSGYSGSGKTTILNQQMLHIATESNHRICYASFEQSREELEIIFTRQINGEVNNDTIDKTMDFLEDKFYWYNYETPTNPNDIFTAFTYAMKRYGCDIFVIDNLITCGLGEEDKDAIIAFVNSLKNFCKKNKVSIHLVAHSRKSQKDDNESTIPGKHTVRGHSSITDVCMNGLTVWRNPVPVQDREAEMLFDGVIQVWKERDEGSLGKTGYYFNRAFKRATDREDSHVKKIKVSDEEENTNETRGYYREDLLEDTKEDF